MAGRTFYEWLGGELERRQVSRRELARRLASGRPDDGRRIESQRRHIKRILSGKTKPTQRTRDAICDALGVPRDAAPSAKDEAEAEDDLLTPLIAGVLRTAVRNDDDLRAGLIRALSKGGI